MDNAATTRMSDAALAAMLDAYRFYGNPSSLHEEGSKARAALSSARKTIAGCIGAHSDEIYFTSGGTEADNLAIKGVYARLSEKEKRHIVTTVIEHKAVLNSVKSLVPYGCEYTCVPIDSAGYVSLQDVENAIRDDTALISVMYANNEIGTIQPIREIADICRRRGVLFHCDAVQAVGHVPIDVKNLGVDLMSISAHKFHGPKGIGALYMKNGVTFSGIMDGGGQEKGMRSGTEAVALAAGMAAALEEACGGMEENCRRMKRLQGRITEELLRIDGAHVNGGLEKRLAGNINMRFDGVDGEALVLGLDLKGIAASSGSACTAGSLEPSHVMTALGLGSDCANGSLRLSIGEDTTDDDADYLVSVLTELVAHLRA